MVEEPILKHGLVLIQWWRPRWGGLFLAVRTQGTLLLGDLGDLGGLGDLGRVGRF